MMKKVLTIIVIGFATICFSCKKESKSFPVAFDMQSNFENDNVNVYVDNVLVFESVISTNHTISLAASTKKTLKDGQHEIKVIVNSKTHSESFNLDSDLYIGVNYNRDSKTISMIYRRTPFLYD